MENENVIKNLNDTVNLIKVIGQAGKDDIGDFKILDNWGNAIVTFTTEEIEDCEYNYNDHILSIKHAKDRSLTISTKALEIPNSHDYLHVTQVTISYTKNDERYTIYLYINGWDYDKLINLLRKNYDDLFDLYMQDTGYNDFSLYDRWDYTIETNNGDSIMAIDAIEKKIKEIKDKRYYAEEKAWSVLENLSEEEIKVLKKVLKNRK